MAIRLDRRHVFIVLLLAAFLAVPTVAEAIDQPFYIGQFRRILILAIVAVSLDLILGYGGMVSLGHAAFFGVGAYVVGILNYHAADGTLFLGFIPGARDALITWPAAIAVTAALAAVIGLISVRTSGIYFIMITLAFAQMLYFVFFSLKTYGGDDGLRFQGDTVILGLIDTRDDHAFYYAVFAILLALLYFSHRLTRSRFGLVIQGARENERRMAAIGFPTIRYKLVCFAVSGAMAGLAGALFAAHESFISPSIMHWTRSGELIVMVVMGGMATLIGPVAGAAVFLLLEKFLPDYTEHWMLFFGPILVLMVLFTKRGIYGLFQPREGGGGGG
jgi:branched-chain amino acid transport system permease protein